MGCVFNRGTRAKPNYYAKFKDRDGAWRMVPTKAATKAAAEIFLRQVEQNVAAGHVGVPQRTPAARVGPLLSAWAAGLRNRSASDDRSRVEVHLMPAFEDMAVDAVSTAVLLDWIEAQRSGTAPRGRAAAHDVATSSKPRARSKSVLVLKPLSEGSIRHNLNTLSRFFAHLIEHGKATINPVRNLPQEKRPRATQRRDIPWIADEAVVKKLFEALPEPFGAMFYLGNRSGLRTGEIAGLRMSDLDWLAEGTVRVRFSYDGPLKEDKHAEGKCKWVPAPEETRSILDPILVRRREQGAGPEDFVFACPTRDGSYYRKELIEAVWERTSRQLGVSMTWYQATRHSFASRNMSRGATLDEVSAAMGHSSPVVTRRYYDHFVRRTFSAGLRTGLGVDPRRDD
jgi:integrase